MNSFSLSNSYMLMETLSSRFWSAANRSTVTSSRSVAIYRWLIGLFALLFVPSFYGWLGDVPKTLFNPPIVSLANLFTVFPSKPFFVLLDILLFISLICLTLGIKARSSALLFVGLKLIGNSFLFSFGKIDHSIFFDLVILTLAFSGWGRHYAVWPDRESRWDNIERSMAVLGVLLCFGFFSAGFEKGLRWIDFNVQTGGFLNWHYHGYYNLGRDLLLAPYIRYVPTPLFELFDYAAVLFELSPFFFLLTSRRNWLLWLTIAAFFHWTNTLLLNIPFLVHLIVYLAFVDYEKGVEWLRREFGLPQLFSRLQHVMIPLVFFLFGLHFAFYMARGTGAKFLFLVDTALIALLEVYVGAFLWPLAALILLCNLLGLMLPLLIPTTASGVENRGEDGVIIVH